MASQPTNGVRFAAPIYRKSADKSHAGRRVFVRRRFSRFVGSGMPELPEG